jgi:hypothetical protein
VAIERKGEKHLTTNQNKKTGDKEEDKERDKKNSNDNSLNLNLSNVSATEPRSHGSTSPATNSPPKATSKTNHPSSRTSRNALHEEQKFLGRQLLYLPPNAVSIGNNCSALFQYGNRAGSYQLVDAKQLLKYDIAVLRTKAAIEELILRMEYIETLPPEQGMQYFSLIIKTLSSLNSSLATITDDLDSSSTSLAKSCFA